MIVSTALLVAGALLLGGAGGVGVTLFATRRGHEADTVEAAVAPALTDAEYRLALATKPGLDQAVAAALSPTPPPCALELAGLLAVVQGGQAAQAMGALEGAAMSRQYQACAAKQDGEP